MLQLEEVQLDQLNEKDHGKSFLACRQGSDGLIWGIVEFEWWYAKGVPEHEKVKPSIRFECSYEDRHDVEKITKCEFRFFRFPTQREEFLSYLKTVKPLEESWTGWKREMVKEATAVLPTVKDINDPTLEPGDVVVLEHEGKIGPRFVRVTKVDAKHALVEWDGWDNDRFQLALKRSLPCETNQS